MLFRSKIQGENKEDVLEIINQMHKQSITSHIYSQFVSLANPHIFVTPSELIDASLGRKRRIRAAKKSIKFLEHCIKARKELNFTQCKLIAPVIIKSSDLDDCPEVKKLVEFSDVDGYLYCGLSSMEDKAETINGIHDILKKHKEKIRIYQGDGNLVEVVLGILNGIDLFESWYPFKLSGEKLAIEIVKPEDMKEPLSESQREELKKLTLKKEVKYIDFNNKMQKELLIPIQKDCGCFTCKNHTRAYINHVIECDEVNWQMLLTM